MATTADELAKRHDLTARKVVSICRAAGIAPLHYVKEGARMVAVFDDDALDRVDEVGSFGRVAIELGTDAATLARAIMKFYPGGALGVPHRLRAGR